MNTTQSFLSECCSAETGPDTHDPFNQICSKCQQLNVMFEDKLKVVGKVCWHNWHCQHLGRIKKVAA